MGMSENCCNKDNNSDNPLIYRRTDGGKILLAAYTSVCGRGVMKSNQEQEVAGS